MIQIIAGEKGHGKTKCLLDKVNTEIKSVHGNIVYLDKNTKHMYELNNKVRLIDVSDFMLGNADEFTGFICGIISQDHDLEQMYFDSFLKIAKLEEGDVAPVLNRLEAISNKYQVTFVISISIDPENLPENMRDKVIA